MPGALPGRYAGHEDDVEGGGPGAEGSATLGAFRAVMVSAVGAHCCRRGHKRRLRRHSALSAVPPSAVE